MRLFKKFLRNKNFFTINKINLFNCILVLAIIAKKKIIILLHLSEKIENKTCVHVWTLVH